MIDNKVFAVGIVALLLIGGMFAVNFLVVNDNGVTGAAFFSKFRAPVVNHVTYTFDSTIPVLVFRDCACLITVNCMQNYEPVFGHSLFVYNSSASAIPVTVDSGKTLFVSRGALTSTQGLTFNLLSAETSVGSGCGFVNARLYVAPQGTCRGTNGVEPDCSQILFKRR